MLITRVTKPVWRRFFVPKRWGGWLIAACRSLDQSGSLAIRLWSASTAISARSVFMMAHLKFTARRWLGALYYGTRNSGDNIGGHLNGKTDDQRQRVHDWPAGAGGNCGSAVSASTAPRACHSSGPRTLRCQSPETHGAEGDTGKRYSQKFDDLAVLASFAKLCSWRTASRLRFLISARACCVFALPR